ncbi:hypothetical protein [Flaviaesturariibacter amylovorans]|uniref:DUF4251 domain-containing protein n=1 Tax=Flaviaesturariibacter amylovorans TaxID=1084520 RepID=A0ABP8G8M5_9BACT
MKYLTLSLLLACCGSQAIGQDVIRYKEHKDASIQRQADSLKLLYLKQGYVLMKENSVNMESQFEFPVVIPLKAGTPYQFVFIGEMSSKIYEVRMFDWSEKQVFYKKHMWGDMDGNIIAYPYMTHTDNYHMMKVLQVNKVKKADLAGYVMLFRRTHSPTELEEQAKKYNVTLPGISTAAVKETTPAQKPAAEQPKNDTTKKKKNNYDHYLENN